MRTGPLVRRAANVSRIGQKVPSQERRRSSRLTSYTVSSARNFPIPLPLLEASGNRKECRLPINLRRFLADQFGSTLAADEHAILDFAARADDETLGRLARAIRRFSTARAREVWCECSASLDAFGQRYSANSGSVPPTAVLCLKCARLEIGNKATKIHRSNDCLLVDLSSSCAPEVSSSPAASAAFADRLQSAIEGFRVSRELFGLPDFDLDCYVTNGMVTFTWRPITNRLSDTAS